ncbi:DUF1559 domain-containing protein [Roseiconus lacunae]|uniref:DUF1559 domain-containing protein n=1 Tax=Roseiconus lacunae TaxID=2605694 RepID=A0ABT7PT40_9BACT|nr:DUF1559 domain-containing protein [Roseiconus lacunae]MDM4019444.1 DUF1559 domain-containing protein [Roseiconus lacunae]
MLLLLAIPIVVLLGSLVDSASKRAHEISCGNNLKQIGLAIENYHTSYNVYPSPNFGGHSWRIRSLGFLMASSMHSNYNYDQSWDSDLNYSLDSRPLPTKSDKLVIYGMPGTYACTTDGDGTHETAYSMVVGASAFGKPDDITDGLETTIAVAETRSRDIHWLEPVDFDATNMSFVVNDFGTLSISSDHPRGPAVLFGDGAVYRLSPRTDPQIVKAMVTIDGGEELDRDRLVLDGVLVAP